MAHDARTIDPMVHASQALTIAAELIAEHIPQLRRDLALIEGDLLGDNAGKPKPALGTDGKPHVNTRLLPGELPDTHFTRFVIIDDAKTDVTRRLPPLLVWESNHDGTAEEYLGAAYDRATAGPGLELDLVFGACKDYPTLQAPRARWVAWMAGKSIRASAFYCGYRGVAKKHVDAAGRVHEAVRRFLDADRDRLPADPRQRHTMIRDYLAQRPPPRPMAAGDLEPIPRRDPFTDDPRLRRAIWQLLRIVVVPMVVVFAVLVGATMAWRQRWSSLLWVVPGAAIVTIALAVAVVLVLRRYLYFREGRDKPDDIHRAVHARPDLIAVEDRIVQNQLTHLVDLKPGLFRYVLQHVVLRAIDLLARFVYLDGHLGNITSIHFGRWVVLKDRRWWRLWRRRDRLVFFSNYDFSWDSYLGEFVDRQATGLTAVWSNTEGFPRTTRLINDGARDEERFKQWARSRQIPSQVWWSGVRQSSVENVNNDVEIHRGLASPPSDLRRWMLRL